MCFLRNTLNNHKKACTKKYNYKQIFFSEINLSKQIDNIHDAKFSRAENK